MTTCPHNIKPAKPRLDGKAIEKLAAQRDIELTPVRKHVLSILAAESRPVGAYELMSQIQLKMGRAMTPPTIYRTLDYLIAHRMVAKIESLKAFILSARSEDETGQIFLICRCCGQGIESSSPELAALIENAAAAANFKIEHSTVEVSGLCQNCQSPA